MTVAYSMIKAIVRDNITPTKISEENIRSEKLTGTEKSAFDFTISFYGEYGTYPSIETIEIECNLPNNAIQGCIDEPFKFWAEQVCEKWVSDVANGLRDKIIDGDSTNFLDIISETQSVLSSDSLKTVVKDMRDLHIEVIQKHDRIQQNEESLGISFGIPFIDGVSGGIQKGDVIVIAGMTGLGKTNMTLKIGREAYMDGNKVLAVCTEMPELQVARRDLAIATRLDSNLFKMGEVGAFLRPKIDSVVNQRVIKYGEEVDNYYKILPGGVYSNIEDISTAVKELKPDLLVVDGAAIVRSKKDKGNRWEGMINIVEAFKHLAMVENVGILLTYHFGKDGNGKVTGIYGGQAMTQFASMLLSFEYENANDANNSSPVQYRILRLLKGRDGEKGSVRMLFNMKDSIIEQDIVLSGLGNETVYDAVEDPTAYDEI